LRRLRGKGFKLTPQRLEIIDILSSDKSHPSVQDILAKARKKAPKMSMSTVYYTLNMLKKEGLIKEIEFYDMEDRYEGNISNHLNLICMKCGKIQDFMEDLPIPLKSVEQKTGFKVNEMRFEYYGCCRECRGKRR
jgi:Fe2+ or Zn2+ uptake regulation protein